MVVLTYWVAIQPQGPGFGITVPDFQEAFGHGRTIEAAAAEAYRAISRAAEHALAQGNKLPTPSSRAEVEVAYPEIEAASWLPVVINVSDHDPSERVNVYLKSSLIVRADQAAAASGMNRSSLMGAALTVYLDGMEDRLRARAVAELAWPGIADNRELMLRAAVTNKTIVVDKDANVLGLGQLGALMDGKPVLIFDMPLATSDNPSA
jgi:predicted RNase H-like HicB family nuclease